MATRVTNPIMGQQVVDVPIDKKCIDITCFDLPSILQAIIDHSCDNSLPDNFDTCLGEFETLEAFSNQVATDLCDVKDRVTALEGADTTISVNNCLSDNWNYDSENCLSNAGSCGQSVETLIQLLVSRTLAYQTKIIELHDTVIDLQSQITTLETRISNVENTCC